MQSLKVKAYSALKEKGVKIIRTDNEENNPMYLINVALGFKPEPFGHEYQKDITSAWKKVDVPVCVKGFTGTGKTTTSIHFMMDRIRNLTYKLIDAGAIPIAKTNMPDMAIGMNGKTPLHGR